MTLRWWAWVRWASWGHCCWRGRAYVCSRLSDKPICTAAPAWAFSTVKRCARFKRRVRTNALLQTSSSAPARNGPPGTAGCWPRRCQPKLSRDIPGYQPSTSRCWIKRCARGWTATPAWRCVGQELTALTEAGGGIQMTIRQPDGSLRAAHARFVLGCDGANSATRDAIDVEIAGRAARTVAHRRRQAPRPPAQLPTYGSRWILTVRA